MSTGDRIKLIRNQLDFSVKEFAEKLSTNGIKVDRGNLSRYENDIIKPSFDFFYSINTAFKVNLNWLIVGVGTIFLKEKGNKTGKLKGKS
jgi:transcriptional regulator with XRE-family HTH domain